MKNRLVVAHGLFRKGGILIINNGDKVKLTTTGTFSRRKTGLVVAKEGIRALASGTSRVKNEASTCRYSIASVRRVGSLIIGIRLRFNCVSMLFVDTNRCSSNSVGSIARRG